MVEWIANAFIGTGIIFMIFGTVGILRLPDLYCRLHALTKVDNLALGFIILGIMLQCNSFFVILKLILIWILVLISSSASSFLISQNALNRGVSPWNKV